MQDLEKCREILLGSGSGQQTELNLPCPGMFHERKQSNFFQVTFLFLRNHLLLDSSYDVNLFLCKSLFQRLQLVEGKTLRLHPSCSNKPKDFL